MNKVESIESVYTRVRTPPPPRNRMTNSAARPLPVHLYAELAVIIHAFVLI